MTPQEKAAQLVVDYQLKVRSLDYKEAVQCAIVTVDEILEDRKEVDGMRVINDPYWLSVKEEIEKL